MPEVPIPSAQVIQVDTRGAIILGENSPATRDSRGIYLPNHIEPVSHIAVDIGGSLAKVVYFTRSTSSPQAQAKPSSPGFLDHALTPLSLEISPETDMTSVTNLLQRRAAVDHIPGGSLNFERFETESIDDCTDFICQLIDRSARINKVSIAEMKKSVKIMATGGGAYRYCNLLRLRTGVDVTLEAEMDCLITGLNFITLIPNEAYYFSDDLIHSVRAHQQTAVHLPASPSSEPLDQPHPNSPQYQVAFADPPTVSNPHLPCLVVNIGSGVSVLRVDASGQFERVSGSAMGGGTLWGLLSLLTGAKSFDEMLALSERGDHSKVDMLVGDIYGSEPAGTDRLGLKPYVIASSFGKVFKKGKGAERSKFAPEDISKSLLYAISDNIGQIAYMNAEKYGLKKIYFGGTFIRGHATTIATLSYAIRFWSKGSMQAMFLRHEGFLGAIGAWIKNIDQSNNASSSSPISSSPSSPNAPATMAHSAPVFAPPAN